MHDEFATGGTFPRPEDVPRLARYDEARMIYDGKHQESLDAKRIAQKLKESMSQSSFQGQNLEGDVYLVLNLPRLICQKFADLQVLQTPVMVPSDELGEEFTEELLEQIPDLWARWHEALSLSRGLGDAIVTVTKDEDEVCSLRIIDPGRWYPVISDNDPEKVEAHQIAWIEVHKEGKRDIDVLRVDVVYPDRLERRAFRLEDKNTTETGVTKSGRKIKAEIPLSTFWVDLPEKDTAELGGLFSCVHLANGRLKSGQIFGRPEFIDSYALIDDVNWRLSAWSDANDKVCALPRVIPASYLQQDEAGNVQVPNQYQRVFEGNSRGEPGDNPTYMSLDLDHDTLKDQFEQSLLGLLVRHEMAPALLGLQFGRERESGEAKSLGMGTTEAATKRDLLTLQPKANQTLTVLGRLKSGNAAATVATHFRVGLPKSQTELMAELMQKKTMGLVTRRQMLIELTPYMTEKQILEQLKALKEEQAEENKRFDPTTPFQG